jgi:hypothetical protein
LFIKAYFALFKEEISRLAAQLHENVENTEVDRTKLLDELRNALNANNDLNIRVKHYCSI